MPVSRELLQFQANLRKTALGVKFSKTLFTNPDSLSAKNIGSILKVLGLKIPPEVQMTADIAQVILGGQAIYQGLNAGKSLADLKQTVGTTSGSTHALTAVLDHNGMMDTQTAQTINVGASVVMLIASAGVDVSAWISLAMDLAAVSASKQNSADIRAVEDLQRNFQSMVQPQFKVVGDTFKEFQEGQIGIFGLIGKIASEAPNMWPQAVQENSLLKKIFPDLQLVPVTTTQIRGFGSDEMWGEWPWGERYVLARWESEKSISVGRIGLDLGFSKEKSAAFVWQYLIDPWTRVYESVNTEIVGGGHSSILSTAILSMMCGGDVEISESLDYAGLMAVGKLTPWDLSEPECINRIVQAALNEDGKMVDRTYRETGISTGYENPSSRAFYNAKIRAFSWVEKLKTAQNIDDFLKYQVFYEALQKYFSFPPLWFESQLATEGSGKYTGRAWRKLNNFISVIHLVEQFKNDPYFANTDFAKRKVPFIPTAAQFEDEFKRIQLLAVARNVNQMSKRQIAQFLGAKPSEIEMVSEPFKYGGSVWKAK